MTLLGLDATSSTDHIAPIIAEIEIRWTKA